MTKGHTNIKTYKIKNKSYFKILNNKYNTISTLFYKVEVSNLL